LADILDWNVLPQIREEIRLPMGCGVFLLVAASMSITESAAFDSLITESTAFDISVPDSPAPDLVPTAKRPRGIFIWIIIIGLVIFLAVLLFLIARALCFRRSNAMYIESSAEETRVYEDFYSSEVQLVNTTEFQTQRFSTTSSTAYNHTDIRIDFEEAQIHEVVDSATFTEPPRESPRLDTSTTVIYDQIGPPPPARREVAIPGATHDPLDGILWYLTKKYGGNIHEKGVVIVSANPGSSDGKFGVPDFVRSDMPQGKPEFHTAFDKPEQWICWDFREMRLRLTRYAIRLQFTQSWRLDGSVDGTTWTLIDSELNRPEFNYTLVDRNGVWWKRPVAARTCPFDVSSPVEFRFIRLTQLARYEPTRIRNSEGDKVRNELIFEAIEFFGTLYE
jgi:hypothetical protein